MCNRDWESSERDAKVAGEHEYWLAMSKDMVAMRAFLQEWRNKVGPSKGPGYKRGGFAFAQYKKTVGTRTFTSNVEEKAHTCIAAIRQSIWCVKFARLTLISFPSLEALPRFRSAQSLYSVVRPL